MKKWSYLISGVLIGAVVATAGSAFADQIKSLVGQTVAGEYTVKVNGSSLAENAIVVDGKAHVPLRAVSDSLGAGIKVDGKTIQIETQASAKSPVETKKNPQQEAANNQINTQNIEARIASIKSDKSFSEKMMYGLEGEQIKLKNHIDMLSNLPTSNDPVTQETRKNSISRTQSKIEENDKMIAEYKGKIAKYDESIAKLEAELGASNK